MSASPMNSNITLVHSADFKYILSSKSLPFWTSARRSSHRDLYNLPNHFINQYFKGMIHTHSIVYANLAHSKVMWVPMSISLKWIKNCANSLSKKRNYILLICGTKNWSFINAIQANSHQRMIKRTMTARQCVMVKPFAISDVWLTQI